MTVTFRVLLPKEENFPLMNQREDMRALCKIRQKVGRASVYFWRSRRHKLPSKSRKKDTEKLGRVRVFSGKPIHKTKGSGKFEQGEGSSAKPIDKAEVLARPGLIKVLHMMLMTVCPKPLEFSCCSFLKWKLQISLDVILIWQFDFALHSLDACLD
ncbi:hypothetical protein Cgig2_030353 [Carnegiea gigantea]|uniref:Uncharacterized protein n=1 Tax=Carnegiea gigantea TaxID=171969 RepID=A0A9Q1KJJ4_9CARY|nr:hypothetical protein Cgig2_030353 [Carnegiea gigantea]